MLIRRGQLQAELEPDRLALVLIQPDPETAESIDPDLLPRCENMLSLSTNVPQAWRRIRALELALRFSTEIGMHPFLPRLASQRLAPRSRKAAVESRTARRFGHGLRSLQRCT